MNTDRYEQAIEGLDVAEGSAVVVVADGHCTWIAGRDDYDQARAVLMAREPLDDEDDEADAEAYAQLCRAIRGPVASTDGGSTRGTAAQQAILALAAESDELIDSDLADAIIGPEADR